MVYPFYILETTNRLFPSTAFHLLPIITLHLFFDPPQHYIYSLLNYNNVFILYSIIALNLFSTPL
jgi:hypothetical protein